MLSFEEKLEKAIALCEKKIHRSYFSRVYSFTTENISGYLRYFDLKDKSLLTVGSSGDQILNAYFNGCRDITLIDINEFAKFYIYLKISAILTLSYEEFKAFFFVHGSCMYYSEDLLSKDAFNKIKPILKHFDHESYLFFEELFKRFDSKTIKYGLIEFSEPRDKVICGFNNYLKNEFTYNLLKKQLKDINFNFINEDIHESSLTNKYDNIFLSNLACYCSLDKLEDLIYKLSVDNLNLNGKILLTYLWNIDYYLNGYEEDWNEIYKLPIVKRKLRQYITEYYQIKDEHSILLDKDGKKDLVLIHKKSW